jgi:hypothetical protein
MVKDGKWIVIGFLLVVSMIAVLNSMIGRTQPSLDNVEESKLNVRFDKSKEIVHPVPDEQVSRVVEKSGGDFRRIFHNFDFDEYDRALKSGDNVNQHVESMLASISEYAIKEPIVPVDESCLTAPQVQVPSDSECRSHSTVFEGKRSRPAKIAHMIQFGFEVDVLEIHLREVYDVVDVFFILESTKAHKGQVDKPLIWERVKHQSRFIPFHDKVVHIILDDIDTASNPNKKSTIWDLENLQEHLRFSKFVEWNDKQIDSFTDDDIIGFGDTDEVAWRHNLNLLKHCSLKVPSVDIGIWFPVCRLDTAFRTDWPVPGHPYTLGDPTFFTIRRAKELLNAGTPPSRNRGQTGKYLLGGMHMTRHNFLPYMLLQSITCSECGKGSLEVISEKRNALTSNIEEAEELWSLLNIDALKQIPGKWRPLDQVDSNEVSLIKKVPWFLSCNPDRYPYWWGRHDTRLDT